MNLLSPSTHLLLVILMPLVGAGIVWLISSRGLQAVRQSAATTVVFTLVAAGWLILRYLMSTEAASNQVFAMVSVLVLNNVVSANNESDLFRYFLFKGKILY